MVNLREVLEPIDIIRRIARIRVEDAYNRLLLRYGMTLGTGAMLRGVQMLIRQMHRPRRRCSRAIGRERRPTWWSR